MTSSSRPSLRAGSSSKQPWGTILRPEFGLGHQRLSEEQIEEAVKRLYSPPPPPRPAHKGSPASAPAGTASRRMKRLSQEQIDAMLERLTKAPREKIPDSDRRLKSSIYRDMGVVSSYAWHGYNCVID